MVNKVVYVYRGIEYEKSESLPSVVAVIFYLWKLR